MQCRCNQPGVLANEHRGPSYTAKAKPLDESIRTKAVVEC
jgi:hypothetical protein